MTSSTDTPEARDVSVRVGAVSVGRLEEYRKGVVDFLGEPVSKREALELAIRQAHHASTVGIRRDGGSTRLFPSAGWLKDARRKKGRPLGKTGGAR